MKRPVLVLSISVLVMGLLVVPGGGAAGAQRAPADSSTALVQLGGEPLATSAATRPAGGGKVDFDSLAVRNERARLAAVRNEFRQWLRANAPAARITKELDVAVHAVGVALNGTSLDTLRAAPMVLAVELQQQFRPVAHDDPDLELVRVAAAWARVGGGPQAGRGVRVAVID
ncbi:MAG TPA: hypothetical protein VFO65_01380, partial [Acidimicrobiales bacterium]|nr:hypothetical protein [Acidimicrobiales bacterium]